MRNSERVDTYQIIEHAFHWEARITRETGGGHSMTYLLGPYFTKKKAKRAAKKNLKSYVVRHKIKRVK